MPDLHLTPKAELVITLEKAWELLASPTPVNLAQVRGLLDHSRALVKREHDRWVTPLSPDVAAALGRISEGIKAAVEWAASYPLSLSSGSPRWSRPTGPDDEAAASVYEQTSCLDLDIALVAQALAQAKVKAEIGR